VALQRPFANHGGDAFLAPVGDFAAGDTLDAPRSSRLMVCEDGSPLGPAHSTHDDIRATGNGQFSHWGDTLYFSASDNSDPNSNGRKYTVIDLSVPARAQVLEGEKNDGRRASNPKKKR